LGAEEKSLNTFSTGYNKDTFNLGYEDWESSFVALEQKYDFGSLALRLNQTQRFGDRGEQFEIDLSPRLGSQNYLYFNLGYSDDNLFPKQRYGAEIYQRFYTSWEASIGYRQLNFNSNVYIFTGSISKSSGDFFYLLRWNSVPKDLGSSSSANLQIRYKVEDKDYISVQIGTGRSLSQLATVSDVVDLGSERISVDANIEVISGWILCLGAGLEKVQISDDEFRRRNSYSVGLNIVF
jgi:YaiO family outer membrane protein